MLATILVQLGRVGDAKQIVSQALQLGQGSADAYDALAHVSLLSGQHELSNSLYKRIVTLAPDVSRFWYNLASSERSFGRLAQAEAACDRSISLDRSQYGAYLLRSELRTWDSTDNHVDELKRELSAASAGDRAKILLGYALAKELDDLKCFDKAFYWMSSAADARRRHLIYDVSVDEQKFRRITEVYQRPAAASREQVSSEQYIFIMGLPRSGTTLLEHILTGLPGVRSNGETDNFARALLSAAGEGSTTLSPQAPDVFQRAAAAAPDVVAANYAKLAGTAEACERIIEKLPMNYLYLGAIHQALPRARLILLRRSAIDSCFAMYRILFGAAYPFSYRFDELARYFAAYDRLVSHWRTVLTDHLHEVSYEELVKEPLRVAANLANECGLPWMDSAIKVDMNPSVSLTASAAQIRRPIYASSCGRWRNYQAHLGPLIDELRNQGVSVATEAP